MSEKARIPKKYRRALLARWSAARVVGPDIPEHPRCPLCAAAARRRKADPAGRDLCDYCPAEWSDKAGGLSAIARPAQDVHARDCCSFMVSAIGDAALAGRILYAREAHARGRPITQAEYDAARRRVLARVEWTSEPEGRRR